MSNNGSVTLVVETKEEEHSFLTETIDLKKLAKKLTTNVNSAVDVLVGFLESKDDRLKMQAATKLLEFHVSVAKEISADQMQRLIAEIKVAKGSKTQKLIDAENGKTKPVVDFTTIRALE